MNQHAKDIQFKN